MPVAVRRLLGLTPGMPVEFVVREGEAVMRKGARDVHPVDVIYGTLRLPRPVDALVEEMRGPGPKPRTGRRRKRPRR